MKPKTKIQKEAWRWHVELPPITEAQKAFVRDKMYSPEGLRKKDCVYCLECGHSWQADESELASNILGVTCPHCGKQLKIHISANRKNWCKETRVMNIVTTCHGYQVTRQFYCEKNTKPGDKAYFSYLEATQLWRDVNEDEMAAIARPKKVLSHYYVDLYDYNEPMRIMDQNMHGHVYDVDGVVYPIARVLPVLKRMGISVKSMNAMGANCLIDAIKDCRIETLVKAGRYDVMTHSTQHEIRRLWPQIKLTIRHNYKIKDFTMWADCINLLEVLGMDTHNPVYVCPKDLRKLHKDLCKKKAKLDEKMAREERRKQALMLIEDNKKFVKRCQKYFGILIMAGDISIRPLQSIDEFVEEGKRQHICVGDVAQKYWNRADSLILTARVGDDIAATIEMSIKNWTIKQCRSACNGVPERYDEIVKALKENKQVFARAKMSA